MAKSAMEAEARTAGDKTKIDETSARVQVKMPNLFTPVYGLSLKPRVNPFFTQCRKESDEWLTQYCGYAEPYKSKFQEQNLPWFAAVMVPDASAEGCRIACDSMQWTTSYDDLHDDSSYFQDNPEAAENLRSSLMAAIEMGPNPIQPVPGTVQAFTTIWDRIVKKSSKGTQRRYAAAVRGFSAATVKQVQDQKERKLLSAEEMIIERYETVGVKALLAVSEYCYDLQIPDEVFEHWTMPEMTRLACEIIAIGNDVVSYRKEEQEGGIPHNVIATFRLKGMSAQEAFDEAGAMLLSRYQKWHENIAAIPSWDPFVDRQVQLYVDLCLNVVQANASWSFMTPRYFGDAKDKALETLTIDVLAEMPGCAAAEGVKSVNGYETE